jgi:predicted DsbA family dithiol-disulfide isomerase
LAIAEEVLAEGQFLGEVIQQRETAASLNASATPFIVVDAVYTIVGLQSQDQYVRALASIRDAR